MSPTNPRPFRLRLAIFAACAVTLLHAANAQQDFRRTINVAGDGSSSAPPDLATITTGVDTRAKTAQAALTANSIKFRKVLNVLNRNGIQDRDVQTSVFNVSPQFSIPKPGSSTPRMIIGYSVSNQVRVKVRDLDNLGDVLDALVAAGSNNINRISFSLEDNKMAADEARRLAIADARSRAQLYAKAAGVTLGKLLSISETTIQQPSLGGSVAFALKAANSVPVASGDIDVTAQVFMLFELLD